MIDFSNKKGLILGCGFSGQAAGSYLLKRNAKLIWVDRDAKRLQTLIPVQGEDDHIEWNELSFCVMSPGIPACHPLVAKIKEHQIPILSELELALNELSSREKKIVAITGSNGKTTTTLLCEHILLGAKIRVAAGGNVGTPLITLIDSDADLFLVEVSSFQLDLLPAKPFFLSAIILNITENHLDRYSSFEAYVASKFRIASCVKENGIVWIKRQTFNDFSSYCSRKGCFFLDSLQEKVETIFSLGYRDGGFQILPHDLENFQAAYAVCHEVGVTDIQFYDGGITFKKPPHRIELVEEIAGVAYINDSKATSIDAVIKAVQSVPRSIILIAGGVDKGGDYKKWVAAFEKKVRRIIVIGEAAERMQTELTSYLPVEKAETLREAFLRASAAAQPGEAVLLSPGCSSYDQFADYRERGEVFKELVLHLKEHQS